MSNCTVGSAISLANLVFRTRNHQLRQLRSPYAVLTQAVGGVTFNKTHS